MQEGYQKEMKRECSPLCSLTLSHNLISLSPDSSYRPLAFSPQNFFHRALGNSSHHKQTPTLRFRLLLSTIPMTCSSALPSVNPQVTLPHSLRTFAPGQLSATGRTQSSCRGPFRHPNSSSVWHQNLKSSIAFFRQLEQQNHYARQRK